MSLRSRLSQIAALTLLSGVAIVATPAVAAVGVATPHPMPPHDTFVNLVAPSQVPGAQALSGSDRTGAASRVPSTTALTAAGVRVTGASEPTPVSSPVVVVGPTWQVGTGQGASVRYRSEQGGRWGPWAVVDADPEHGPDPGSAEASNVRAGSDPPVPDQCDRGPGARAG